MDLESPPLAAFPGVGAVHAHVTHANTCACTHNTHMHTNADTDADTRAASTQTQRKSQTSGPAQPFFKRSGFIANIVKTRHFS